VLEIEFVICNLCLQSIFYDQRTRQPYELRRLRNNNYTIVICYSNYSRPMTSLPHHIMRVKAKILCYVTTRHFRMIFFPSCCFSEHSVLLITRRLFIKLTSVRTINSSQKNTPFADSTLNLFLF